MQAVIQKMPESLPELKAHISEGRQPERICALFLCALALFDRDKDAGTDAMDILRVPRPMTPYDCQFLCDRLRGKAYLPLAYFEGATPENGYRPQASYPFSGRPVGIIKRERKYLKMEFANMALDATGRPGTFAEILPRVWQSV